MVDLPSTLVALFGGLALLLTVALWRTKPRERAEIIRALAELVKAARRPKTFERQQSKESIDLDESGSSSIKPDDG